MYVQPTLFFFFVLNGIQKGKKPWTPLDRFFLTSLSTDSSFSRVVDGTRQWEWLSLMEPQIAVKCNWGPNPGITRIFTNKQRYCEFIVLYSRLHHKLTFQDPWKGFLRMLEFCDACFFMWKRTQLLLYQGGLVKISIILWLYH